MAVGDRIKSVRNFRKITMKELGMAVGFDEKSADVRIAQYENNSRKPKEELLNKIAAALDVNVHALSDISDYTDEDLLYALFQWEDARVGVDLLKVWNDTHSDFEGENTAVAFNYSMLDTYLDEWYLRKQQLRSGEITRDEYQEWKLNWPYTSDVMRKYVPHREWRKKEE